MMGAGTFQDLAGRMLATFQPQGHRLWGHSSIVTLALENVEREVRSRAMLRPGAFLRDLNDALGIR
jgi:hypothetical protein